MADAILAPSGIYIIHNTIRNKCYVGSAVNTTTRITHHRSFLNRGKHANSKLQRAWVKYGASAFSFAVVEIVAKPEDLISREQYWIDAMNAVDFGYNIRRVAQSNQGFKHSQETRIKMSLSQLGTKRHTAESKARLSLLRRGVPCHSDEAKQRMRIERKGRRHTDAAKAKIAISSTGRPQSAETRAKRALALRAAVAVREPFHHSPEQRAQWSIAHKGKPAKNRKPILLFGVEYVSITAASQAIGRNPQWVKARAGTDCMPLGDIHARPPVTLETRMKKSIASKGIPKSAETIAKRTATVAAKRAAKLAAK